ncbi:hypothetical protein GCM10027592_45070 [Spirosoma flavus]
MDALPKITIVIPTRERLSTLQWTLKTCLTPQVDNYEILVSDNFSQDGTRDYVESLRDPRIRYVNTGKRISMSHNWEFALSHIAEGFVSYVGDDDGILPDTIERVRSYIKEYNVAAVNSKAINYCWPSHIDPALKNLLTIPLKKGFTLLESSAVLTDVAAGLRTYHDLPWLYGGFVSVDIINTNKKRSGGSFFLSQIPDVYSGVSLTKIIPRYGYSYKPLIINGISGHSTGSSYFSPDKSQKSQTTFSSEENIPFHHKFVPGPAIQVLISESWQQAYDRKLIDSAPDIRATLIQAAKESRVESSLYQQKAKEMLLQVAHLNEIPASFVEELFAKPSGRGGLTKKIDLVKKYLSQKIAVADASRWKVTNVYEASQLCDKLLHNNNGWGFVVSNLGRFALSRISAK